MGKLGAELIKSLLLVLNPGYRHIPFVAVLWF